jgi:eukaryotic-like serine/threonine-protein kinase
VQTVGGRYAIEDTLDRGGRLYRARHLQLGKDFALEVIAPAFDDETARERFQRDARLASEINHPNLVPVVDFGEDPAVGAYVVSELVEGAPLIAAGGAPFSPRRSFDALSQLAGALEHLHRRGIIYSDLTASRIVVSEAEATRRNVVRLLDLGVACRHQHDGTPQYLAPERVAGALPSVGSDIYALGVLGFTMLAGRLPFEGSVAEVLRAHVDARPPAISELRGEALDPAIEALIGRALAKHPDERHRSAGAFRFELEQVADKLSIDRRRISTSGLTKPENPREATVLVVFEHGALAQAVVTQAGTISVANRAFAQLLGETRSIEGYDLADTKLVTRVPDLLRTVRAVQRHGTAMELRAGELTVWVAPFSSEAVHLLVRVDQILS